MGNNTEVRLIDISQADGWFAELRDQTGSTFLRVPCWGLFEATENGRQFTFMSGVDADPQACTEPMSDYNSFARFIHFDDMTDGQRQSIVPSSP